MLSCVNKLLVATTLVACSPLGPSGGREGEPARAEPTPASAPKTPDAPPPAVPLDDDVPKPLAIAVTVVSADGLFKTAIEPTLATNCTNGGCHAVPSVIDLRAFPFAAEGSYALDDIRGRLGDAPGPQVVQVELVKVLIDAMRTLYMPPGPAAPVEEPEIAPFDAWLAEDLKTAAEPFTGKIEIKAFDADGATLCTLQGEIVDGTYRGEIARRDCGEPIKAVYTILASDGTAVGEGGCTGEEFRAKAIWKIETTL